MLVGSCSHHNLHLYRSKMQRTGVVSFIKKSYPSQFIQRPKNKLSTRLLETFQALTKFGASYQDKRREQPLKQTVLWCHFGATEISAAAGNLCSTISPFVSKHTRKISTSRNTEVNCLGPSPVAVHIIEEVRTRKQERKCGLRQAERPCLAIFSPVILGVSWKYSFMPFTPVKSESSICPYQGGVFNILQLNLCLLLAP